MLQYPSIPSWRYAPLGRPCVAYYKYDGSNLRFEYSPKRGWYKFGARHTMIDHTHPDYGQAIRMFTQPYDGYNSIASDIVRQCLMTYNKIQNSRIVAFCEFFGPSSFAGSHDPTEDKQLRLLDISVFKRGFLPPKDFNRLFNGAPYGPEIIYEGVMDEEFITDVRSGMVYNVYEGVVCKGDDWRAKIKTDPYLDRLKSEKYNQWETEQNE